MGYRRLRVGTALIASVLAGGVPNVRPRVPVRGISVVAVQFLAGFEQVELLVSSPDFSGPEHAVGTWDGVELWEPVFDAVPPLDRDFPPRAPARARRTR